MKTIFSALLVALIAISPVRAQETNPILLELRPQLQAAMQKVAPDATWELKGNELTASYKTRDFVIYPISPQGDVAAQPQQELGPANGGFILRVRIFPEIPDFALKTPQEMRQAYWKTFTTRYNLHFGTISNSPQSQVLSTEREAISNDRKEFWPVPQNSVIKLLNLVKSGLLANAGLSESAHIEMIQKPMFSRYEGAVLLMRVLDAIPNLDKDKTNRVKALRVATTTRKLSTDEIELLDSDIRDLQAEFAGEIQKINSRGSALEERDIRPSYPLPPRRVLFPKPQPAYLVFTLQTPLNNDMISPQPFTKIIEETVRENNRRADGK